MGLYPSDESYEILNVEKRRPDFDLAEQANITQKLKAKKRELKKRYQLINEDNEESKKADIELLLDLESRSNEVLNLNLSVRKKSSHLVFKKK